MEKVYNHFVSVFVDNQTSHVSFRMQKTAEYETRANNQKYIMLFLFKIDLFIYYLYFVMRRSVIEHFKLFQPTKQNFLHNENAFLNIESDGNKFKIVLPEINIFVLYAFNLVLRTKIQNYYIGDIYVHKKTSQEYQWRCVFKTRYKFFFSRHIIKCGED